MILENRESLLPLVGQCEKTLLIWGEGWKCIQLAQLCEALPKPLLMDEKTLKKHQSLIELVGVTKTKSSRVILLADIYDIVIQQKSRIEQEKMIFEWKLLDDLSLNHK